MAYDFFARVAFPVGARIFNWQCGSVTGVASRWELFALR